MNTTSRIPILFFALGAMLCLFPLFSLPWIENNGINLITASELIPSFAKVDHNQSLQLEMPIYFVRQQFIPFLTNIPSSYSYFFVPILLLACFFLLFEIKRWARISNRQFWLGIILWFSILTFKLLSIPASERLLSLGTWTLSIAFLGLATMAVLASQTIPYLILQFGKRSNFQKTKRTYLLLYSIFLLNIVINLIQQEGGNSFKPVQMLISLCIYWALFWFTIANNPILQKYKLGFSGLLLLCLASIWWFFFHLNDPAIRFAFEWSIRCLTIMAFLFPAFIYTNFKEIFNQNLDLHLVVFKAHRLKFYLYQIGVVILGLAWTFAKNASLFHILLAGYNNQVGDLESIAGQPQFAKISYQTAQANSRLNFKSNFELAKLGANDEEKAQYLNYTLSKFEQPSTYLHLAFLYQNNDHAFQALFTLQEGFEKFPNSHELATSIAVQYEKLGQVKEAKSYYDLALKIAPGESSVLANSLYAQGLLAEGKGPIPNGFESDLGVQGNRLALGLMQQKLMDEPFEKDFQMEQSVQHFAYLYNFELMNKSKSTHVDFEKLFKNESLLGTFPELKLLDVWQDYYEGKKLKALQKISFLKENYAGSEANPYEQLFIFWHQTLNEPTTDFSKLDCLSALEQQPFSLEVQNHCFPILNSQRKEKIAYDYALAAIQFNPKRAELYPNYIFQALKMSETSYAQEAMETLKNLNSGLFEANKQTFEKQLELVRKKQAF